MEKDTDNKKENDNHIDNCTAQSGSRPWKWQWPQWCYQGRPLTMISKNPNSEQKKQHNFQFVAPTQEMDVSPHWYKKYGVCYHWSAWMFPKIAGFPPQIIHLSTVVFHYYKPSRGLTYPTLGSSENQLQIMPFLDIFGGYVSSLEGKPIHFGGPPTENRFHLHSRVAPSKAWKVAAI